MNSNQFEKALRIIKKTGDKMVIFDKENDHGVMVMSLDDYEMLNDLNDLNNLPDFDPLNELDDDELEEVDDSYYNDDLHGFENEEDEDVSNWGKESEELDENLHLIEEEVEEEKIKKDDNDIKTVPIPEVNPHDSWQSVGNIIQEEPLDDVKDFDEDEKTEDDLEDDDKFYLEPVE